MDHVRVNAEQRHVPDAENGPVGHPQLNEAFDRFDGERYLLKGDELRPN